MKRSNAPIRALSAILSGLLRAGVLAVPAASGGTARARAHAATGLLTGIGNEKANMLSDRRWQVLHTRIVRYIAPYDAVRHGDSMALASAFIRQAEAQHQQVLIAFYHSEHSPTRLPSVPAYQQDVQRFIKRFPHVHEYQAWDEANRASEPHMWASPSAPRTALYYQALLRVCHGCTVIGLDVLDQAYIAPTLRYIAEFKRAVRGLHAPMPRVWGLHDYSDVNRFESWRTHQISRALGGQVWLTETGGIVKLGRSFTNIRGSGLRRAARVLKYTFDTAYSTPQVKRLYVYDWSGAGPGARFDAGLTNIHNQPREGYVVVCRELHAIGCGHVRPAHN